MHYAHFHNATSSDARSPVLPTFVFCFFFGNNTASTLPQPRLRHILRDLIVENKKREWESLASSGAGQPFAIKARHACQALYDHVTIKYVKRIYCILDAIRLRLSHPIWVSACFTFIIFHFYFLFFFSSFFISSFSFFPVSEKFYHLWIVIVDTIPTLLYWTWYCILHLENIIYTYLKNKFKIKIKRKRIKINCR